MQRRSVIMLGVSAVAATLVRPALAQNPWRTLFDGQSLAGWSPIGNANWSLENGMVQADNGMGGYLVSNESFGDFELRVQIWVSDNANSGIFIRATDPAVVTPQNAYEVNVYDQRPDPSYGTGAIVDLAKVGEPPPKAGARWNFIEITAKGDRFSVVFNGRKTVDNAQDAKHASGRVALQYGAGQVKFRRVEIRQI